MKDEVFWVATIGVATLLAFVVLMDIQKAADWSKNSSKVGPLGTYPTEVRTWRDTVGP